MCYDGRLRTAGDTRKRCSGPRVARFERRVALNGLPRTHHSCHTRYSVASQRFDIHQLCSLAHPLVAYRYFPALVKLMLPLAPLVGIFSTVTLVGSAVSQVAEPIMNAGLGLQLPILLLHLVGGLVGFALPKALGFGEVACRTMAIETSMKSSAFG